MSFRIWGKKYHHRKKIPWHLRWQGQKKAFLKKVHFIQKWTVTQNTVFLVSQKYFFVVSSNISFIHQIQSSNTVCSLSFKPYFLQIWSVQDLFCILYLLCDPWTETVHRFGRGAALEWPITRAAAERWPVIIMQKLDLAD